MSDPFAAIFDAFAEPVAPPVYPKLADLGLKPRRAEALRAELRRQGELESGDDPNTSRLPWPDDWFETSSPHHYRACRRLWASCLLTNIRALLHDQKKEPSELVPSWLGSRDFVLICDLVGIHAPSARAAVQRALGDPVELDRLDRALTYAQH